MARARPSLEKAVNEILLRHGTEGKRLSFRQAERRTGLSPATISELAKGNARTAETIRRFAEGMGEDSNRLLLLAGFVPAEEPVTPSPLKHPTNYPTNYPTNTDPSTDQDLSPLESLLLERLKTSLSRLPHGSARQFMQEQLRHTAELLERFVELRD